MEKFAILAVLNGIAVMASIPEGWQKVAGG